MDKQIELGLGGDEQTPPYNVLPFDGESVYYGPIFERSAATSNLNYLLQGIPWKPDEAVIYGKLIVTARKVAWFGDRSYDYTYSGRTRTALIWTPELLELKKRVEEVAGTTYNSCLLNLYADGMQGMAWHHDDEKELGDEPNIASVSFGAERRFDFRHKRKKQKVSLQLEHGSLLVMQGTTQSHWQHQIPKTKKIDAPRVNLTFRRMTGK